MLRDCLSDLGFRLRALTGRAAAERDMAEEMDYHVERETERLVREGFTRAEANRRARLAFGGVEQVKEAARDAWGIRAVEHLGLDLAHAVRLARRQPGFSAVVVLSLALGLGATLTVFNLTWNVLYATLPLSNPGELVSPVRWSKDGRDNAFRWSEVQALRLATPGVAFAAIRGASAVAVTAGEHREFINLTFVDGDFFPVSGLRAAAGRLISRRDDAEAAPVVVLTDAFARVLFPGAESVVGSTVSIRGASFTVIGVTPPGFRGVDFPGSLTAAIPIGSSSLLGATGEGHDNRGIPYGRGDPRPERPTFRLVGRATTDVEAARVALTAVFSRCCATQPGGREWLELVDMSRGIPGGKNDNRQELRGTLAVVMGGMGLVLIVVCCNIAGLLLVRAAARQREIALRLSLGASRARLTWQLVLESAPLALAGAVGGFVLAAWFTAVLVHALPGDWDDLRPMAAFSARPVLVATTATLALACTLAFAVYPAARAASRPLGPSLRMDARASRTRRQGTVARWVIVGQVAITMVIVTAAALLTATLANVMRADTGIESDHMLLAGLGTRSTTYEATGVLPIAEDIARAIEALPGVRAVTMATQVPLHGGSNYSVGIRIPGREGPPGHAPEARLVLMRPEYFAAVGMRLVSGRDLTASDAGQGEAAVVVSEAFVSRYLKGRDPLGQAFGFSMHYDDHYAPMRVVGVVRDARYESMRENPRPYVYASTRQSMSSWRDIQLVVRTTGVPMSAVPAVLKAVERAAPGIEARRVRDMETQRAWSAAVERLTARLATFASAMALVLSAVGLYGVVAYGVSRRTSEIGVRLALGATARAILWLVSRETVWLVGGGVLVGAALSYGATGAMKAQFYGVAAHDPFVALGAALALVVAGLAAGVVPARRAARIDPKIALNAD